VIYPFVASVASRVENAPVRQVSGALKDQQWSQRRSGLETVWSPRGGLRALETTALALGNVYGPRQDPLGAAGVVSIFTAALLEGRPTAIYGDGGATRDYVCVDDVVEAFVLAAGSAGNGLRLNIGTGRETSVRELHRLIAQTVRRPDTPRLRGPRTGELHRVVFDCAAARRVLGWRADTVLEVGLARTAAWLMDSGAVASRPGRDRPTLHDPPRVGCGSRP
jgi:nucleoside-diphosphate-sugar epimerase